MTPEKGWIEITLPPPSPPTAGDLIDADNRALVDRLENAAVEMVKLIRVSDADARTKHAALRRIFDVAEFHFEKHRRENGL